MSYKGLYKKARAKFTGISALFEEPLSPEIHIHTDKLGITESVKAIIDYLTDKEYFF
nr:3932_t:CDS:2 [Entrophospora candida]